MVQLINITLGSQMNTLFNLDTLADKLGKQLSKTLGENWPLIVLAIIMIGSAVLKLANR